MPFVESSLLDAILSTVSMILWPSARSTKFGKQLAVPLAKCSFGLIVVRMPRSVETNATPQQRNTSHAGIPMRPAILLFDAMPASRYCAGTTQQGSSTHLCLCCHLLGWAGGFIGSVGYLSLLLVEDLQTGPKGTWTLKHTKHPSQLICRRMIERTAP